MITLEKSMIFSFPSRKRCWRQRKIKRRGSKRKDAPVVTPVHNHMRWDTKLVTIRCHFFKDSSFFITGIPIETYYFSLRGKYFTLRYCESHSSELHKSFRMYLGSLKSTCASVFWASKISPKVAATAKLCPQTRATKKCRFLIISPIPNNLSPP